MPRAWHGRLNALWACSLVWEMEEGMTLREFVFIPVWLLTLAMKPFLPNSHPWKKRPLTLKSWGQRGTPEAFWMSLNFWLSWFTMAVCIRYVIVHGFR